MYYQFYGLKEAPFNLTPDPRFCFLTNSHREVLANLQYGVQARKGLIVMTGEVGTGKTTMIRSLFETLDKTVLAAYILNPKLSLSDFLQLLVINFGLKNVTSKATLLERLGKLLVDRHARGLITALIIDEAHALSAQLLEEVRLLSNFETYNQKLLQIVLSGQPELRDLLNRPELRQLKQRISLRCHIKPLTPAETRNYILSRLEIAGAVNPFIFANRAIELVYQYSAGVPRIINNICDNALLSGFALERGLIGEDIIREVARDFDLEPPTSDFNTTAPDVSLALEPSGAGEVDVEQRQPPGELARTDAISGQAIRHGGPQAFGGACKQERRWLRLFKM